MGKIMKTNDLLNVQKSALYLSAIIAPISLPILFFLANYLFSGSTDRSIYVKELINETSFVILPLSYIFSLPLGLAIGFLLYRLNKFSVRHIMLFFALSGSIFGIVFPLMAFDNNSNNSSIISSLIYGTLFGMAGLVVSTTFCVLNRLLDRLIHSRPD